MSTCTCPDIDVWDPREAGIELVDKKCPLHGEGAPKVHARPVAPAPLSDNAETVLKGVVAAAFGEQLEEVANALSDCFFIALRNLALNHMPALTEEALELLKLRMARR